MIYILLCKTTSFNFFTLRLITLGEGKKKSVALLYVSVKALISDEESRFKEAEWPARGHITVHGLEPKFPHFYLVFLYPKLFASVLTNYALVIES